MTLEAWTGGDSGGIGSRPPELLSVGDMLSFRLPGVVVSDAQVFAMALDNTQDCLALGGARLPGGAPLVLDGVLGAPFFRSLVVEIDYRGRHVHLYDPRTYTYTGKGKSLPIEMDENYTYVDAQLATGRHATHAKLVVDTGADALSLTRQFAEAHGVLPPAKRLTAGAECGVKGLSNDPTLVGKLDRLRLGPFTVRKPMTAFYQATPDRTYDGLLGADALQHFKVIFDYSRRRMILEQAHGTERGRQ